MIYVGQISTCSWQAAPSPFLSPNAKQKENMIDSSHYNEREDNSSSHPKLSSTLPSPALGGLVKGAC